MADWGAVVVSIAAFFVATMTYVGSKAAVRSQVFLDLRKRFSDLKNSIPDWYDKSSVPATATSEELRACELYWQNAFDEWFITTWLERRYLHKLWQGRSSGQSPLGQSQ